MRAIEGHSSSSDRCRGGYGFEMSGRIPIGLYLSDGGPEMHARMSGIVFWLVAVLIVLVAVVIAVWEVWC